MIKMFNSIFLTITALVIATGCSRAQQSAYFPTAAKGDVREYSMNIMAPHTGIVKGKATERVEGEVEIRGKTYLKVIMVPEGIPGMPTRVKFHRYAKDGLYVIEESPNNTEFLEVPFPLTVGKKWSYTSSTGTTTCKAEAIEDLYLPDRTIKNCLKIVATFTRKDGITMTGSTYRAPNFGIIKTSGGGEGVSLEVTLIKPVVK